MRVILAILLILVLFYTGTGSGWVLVPGMLVLVVIGTCMMLFALVARFFRWLISGGEIDEPDLRLGSASTRPKRISGPVSACPERNCRHANPAHARFCARCGKPLATP